MFYSRLSSLYDFILVLISGGYGDYIYRFVLFILLFCFLYLRIPYLYGMSGFGVSLFFLLFPLFLGLLISRLVDFSLDTFFSGFVPLGTPLWIAPFVCLAETLSYVVRPLVLMIRPFVNLSIGALGAHSLGVLFFVNWGVGLFLFVLFFYELFVALVHWFIVCNILSFSEGH